ncbi:MAG: hypothetical protein PHU53_01430 [Thermoplasmata archaeon]|nr:hypothetical protein [Thermoplasmata archaeon]
MWEWTETPSGEKAEKMAELNRQYPHVNKTLMIVVGAWSAGCFALTASMLSLVFIWNISDKAAVVYAYFCCLYGLSILIWTVEFRRIHHDYYDKVYEIIGTPAFMRRRISAYLLFIILAVIIFVAMMF